ncbi:MAG: 2Fe-2S iron-sulfur cluster binding domain-containing protein [Proteobacteria bacterium]|nr:2Fe-2S iron-sulfur cluster binding domain-containing protein [Pseudomonadota bacterium]
MKHFHNLTVARIEPETPDSVCVYLSVPEELRDEYAFVQGQHLPVRAEIDGVQVRRTYSICSAIDDPELRIGVRVQKNGLFSGYIANILKAGDVLEAMPPVGHFQTPLSAEKKKNYVAFVSGSGITPLLSIAKTTLATEPQSRFFLFYANRTHESTMFLEELYALKNQYPDRLSLHFVFSREEQEFEIASGRFDADKVRQLYQGFCAGLTADEVFICGPGTMSDTVKETLVELGISRGNIHSERFAVSKKTEPAPKTVAPQPADLAENIASVTVILDGHTKKFAMPMDDMTLLEAGREHGLELPASCEAGVCSTCRTHLREGKVEMEENYALEPWEVEEGFILACQARPLSRTLIIDYDKT